MDYPQAGLGEQENRRAMKRSEQTLQSFARVYNIICEALKLLAGRLIAPERTQSKHALNGPGESKYAFSSRWY